MTHISQAVYPRLDLEVVLAKLRVIDARLTRGGASIAKAEMTKALGYSGENNGSMRRILAAFRHYGLLEGEGADLAFTGLALRLLQPMNSIEKRVALREAATRPVLFKKLLIHLNHRQLLLGELASLLVEKYGVHQSSGVRIANCFLKTMKYVGFLENDNLLRVSPENDGGRKDSNAGSMAQESTGTSLNRVDVFVRDGIRISLQLPEDFTQHEADRLKRLIDGMVIVS